jgi:hypothetical protein
MGHSTIALAFDRYGHLLDGQDGDIAASLVDPFTLPEDSNVRPLVAAEASM